MRVILVRRVLGRFELERRVLDVEVVRQALGELVAAAHRHRPTASTFGSTTMWAVKTWAPDVIAQTCTSCTATTPAVPSRCVADLGDIGVGRRRLAEHPHDVAQQ